MKMEDARGRMVEERGGSRRIFVLRLPGATTGIMQGILEHRLELIRTSFPRTVMAEESRRVIAEEARRWLATQALSPHSEMAAPSVRDAAPAARPAARPADYYWLDDRASQ